jgi:hypothetical protein
MRYLIQGGEDADRLDLIISLTKITSENVQQALIDHFKKGSGLAAETAAALNGVQLSNFTRAATRLEEVAASVERIKEIDWRHLKSAITNKPEAK